MHQLGRTAVRNSLAGIMAQAGIKVASVLFLVLVVRHLGAEAYGQYAAVLAFGTMVFFVADPGLGGYAVREVARHRADSNGPERVAHLYGNIFALRLLLSVLAGVLLLTAAWVSQRPPALVGGIALGALGLVIYAVYGASEAVLLGFERADLSSYAKVVNQLVFVGLGTGVLLLGFGYYGLILASCLAAALMAYLCWRWVRTLGIRLGRVAVHTWPGLLRASFPFGIGVLALALSYRFDSVLLNVSWGDAETGYYNAAYGLIFSLATISNAINLALYPSLARQADAGGMLPEACRRIPVYLLSIALSIAVGGWALAGQLVPLLFTSAYLPTVEVLRIIVWVVPLMFVSEFLGYILAVLGMQPLAARAAVLSAGLNLSLNLILVPRLGASGAAAVTVATEAALVGQYLWLLRGRLPETTGGAALVRPMAAAVAMGAVLTLLQALPLVIRALGGGAVYLALLVALGVLGKREFALAQSIWAHRPTPDLAVASR